MAATLRFQSSWSVGVVQCPPCWCWPPRVPPQQLAACCHSCLPTELEFYLLHKPDRQQLLDKQAAMAAEAALGRPPGGSIARPPVLPLPFDSHNYSGAGGFEGAATGGCHTAGRSCAWLYVLPVCRGFSCRCSACTCASKLAASVWHAVLCSAGRDVRHAGGAGQQGGAAALRVRWAQSICLQMLQLELKTRAAWYCAAARYRGQPTCAQVGQSFPLPLIHPESDRSMQLPPSFSSCPPSLPPRPRPV